MAGNFVERNAWPDVRAAVAARMAGRRVPQFHAIDRYLLTPPPRLAGERALDVCCGAGQGALVLRARGYEVDAFDKYPGGAQAMREAGVRFTATMFRYFVPRQLADLICACECLEHFEEPAAALEKFDRWLAPQGRIFLTVPIENCATSPNPYHRQAWRLPEFLKLLSAWRVEKSGHMNRLIFWALLRRPE